MERCIRCGAQSKNTAVLGAAEIFLCQHHTDEHAAALEDQGWDVWSLDAEGVSA